MSGKQPTLYSAAHITEALIELIDELQGKIQHLTGAQIASLLMDKLDSWIDPPGSPSPPTITEDGA